jgi:S1-C subfamily serine protease
VNRASLPGNNPGLEQAAKKGKAAVVFIYTLTSDTATSYAGSQTGSGVIISEDGFIVTNHHVIEGGIEIYVQLDNRRQFMAQLIGTDSTHDVAVLKIKASGLPFLSFGNSDSLHIGEQVLAIGNPYKLQSTVTSGIVSALDRDIKLGNNATQNFIQTDAPINMGNSGGALLNSKGQLMGLNIAMITTSGEYEGFSFALPSNLVKKITEDLKQFGTLQKAVLGITIRAVNQEIADESGMTAIYGVVVDALTPGGSADSAGIQSLDILLSVDGKNIQSNADFKSQLSLHRPGDVISLRVLRNRKVDTVRVRLEEVKKE